MKNAGMIWRNHVATHIPGVAATGLPTWGPSSDHLMVVKLQCQMTTTNSATLRTRSMNGSLGLSPAVPVPSG
ncbi:MAG: hypothetical protein V9F03_02385 [Microthrixaceae bacterium]